LLYAILVIAMRMMGRRLASQLTRTELIALVSLAAAVGPAITAPDQGLLPAAIVATWVVFMQRTMARGSFRSHLFEHWLQGEPAILACDGRLDVRALRHNGISRDMLFAKLRARGVRQLGVVERVYLEPNGTFNTVMAREQQPGLPVLPEWDREFLAAQKQSLTQRACTACGTLVAASRIPSRCASCGGRSWTEAIEP
jgi:uncharacterized membrane protein YcaP (DUF421 family)